MTRTMRRYSRHISIGAAGAAALSMATQTARAEERLRPVSDTSARYAMHGELQVGDEPARVFDAELTATWADLERAPAVVTVEFSTFSMQAGGGETLRTLSAHIGDEGSLIEGAEAWDEATATSVRVLLGAPLRLALGEDGRVQAARRAIRRMGIGAGGGEVDLADGALGPLATAQVGRTLEPIFSADGAPSDGVNEWETAREWALGPSRTVTLEGDWTSERAADGSLRWRGEYSIATGRLGDASPIAPDVRVDSFEGDVEASWDSGQSLLQERMERLSFEAVWTIGDLEERVAVRSTLRLQLLEIVQAPEAGEADPD